MFAVAGDVPKGPTNPRLAFGLMESATSAISQPIRAAAAAAALLLTVLAQRKAVVHMCQGAETSAKLTVVRGVP